MTPRVLLGTAEVPSVPPLKLFQRGGDFTIAFERNDLMSGSEAALGTLTCQRLATDRAPRLLIGGYGMGLTLRAVLKAIGPTATVIVAELVPAIIEWARGPMQMLTAGCLDDPRVEIRLAAVATLLGASDSGYDAILLDVDNGPDGLTRPRNDGLYSASGLARARAALRSGGTLAVWSAAPDTAFARRLVQAGFTVDEVRVRARSNGKGPTHVVGFASV